MIFRPPSLLATQVVPTAGIENRCQGSRGVYIRANRGSLPPRASDILAVRIGQLTAEVFHLLVLHRPCVADLQRMKRYTRLLPRVGTEVGKSLVQVSPSPSWTRGP